MSVQDPTTPDRRESERFILNMLSGFKRQLPDADAGETQEWLDALEDIVRLHGRERADFLLRRVLKRARQLHVGLPGLVQSRYINTISTEQEPPFPGDEPMEKRIRRIIRWNAAAMVLRAKHEHAGLCGHLSTYASAASLYEVGFNHFFRGKDDGGLGDQFFFQGDAAPGAARHEAAARRRFAPACPWPFEAAFSEFSGRRRKAASRRGLAATPVFSRTSGSRE